MKKIYLNLGLKLILIGVAGIILIFAALGTARLYTERGNLLKQMEFSGKERASLIAESLSNLVIAFDYGNIESLCDRIVLMQDVRQVRVYGRNGKLMVGRSSSDYSADREGLSFTAPVIFSGAPVGSVELELSLDRYDRQIKDVYYNVVRALLIALLFVILLIYIVVTKYVVSPIFSLSKAADRLAMGDFEAELPRASDDEMGTLIRAFASMRESRKLSEARLKAVFEQSPDAFIQLDSEGNIIDWNDKANQVWGYSRNEILGENFSRLLPDTALGLNPGYRKCYQKTEGVIGSIRDVVGLRKDGTLFPLELRTSEILLEGGEAFLVLARDITQRKENENRLVEAMKAAEAANAAKSAFLSNMSHEIRTPMNSIIGLSKLALKTHLNPKQHDYLSKIDFSATHLLGLINDVLDFSKIEANRLELEISDFELKKIFDTLSAQLLHSATAKQLKLEFSLDAALRLPLRGDAMRLSQILLNYIGNAIKFTEEGGVTVRALPAGSETGKQIRIRFEVEDTGIGLGQEDVAGLFQPFHQADVSTTRKFGGTGLGLAISKQLVELMGGEVGVESMPGKGSLFWFTVILERGQEIRLAASRQNGTFVNLRGASILLVEDNPFNQQVAVEMLKDAGIGVTLANNGQEALEILGEQKYFDCILMDLQMPVMDGLEATRRIRSSPELSTIPIVAMTANAAKEDRMRCLEAGMNDFVTKPVFHESLFKVLSACLEINRFGKRDGASLEAEQEAGKLKINQTDGESAMLDLSLLAKMLGHDKEKVEKFTAKFIESARQGLAEISEALQQGDMLRIASLGHRNKSPARTVGAIKYADLCQSLERFREGGALQEAVDIVQQMKVMLDEIENQIEQKRDASRRGM